MASGFNTRNVAAGGLVFREGDRADGAYMVLDGQIRIYTTRNGHETTLATLKTGDFFGEMALFDGKPRSASAQAVRGAALLRYVGREEFDAVTADPFVRQLLTELTQRLRTTDEALTKLETESAARHDFVSQHAFHRDWVV